jgi:XRE family transcriptional regulator, aerobic/anaerobic benzoate catabolism transcriptional regulator
MNRVIAQGDLRPMRGREHAMVELRAILEQRRRLYAMADLAIDTSGRTEQQCVEQLLSQLGPLQPEAGTLAAGGRQRSSRNAS